MLEEVAYALAGVYTSDTFRFNLAAHYLNLDKGRHMINAFSGLAPGVCIGYVAQLISGKSGLMETCALAAIFLNLTKEFPIRQDPTPTEINEMYAKLRKDSHRND